MEPPEKHPSEELLSAYRDRELAPGERARLEAHLAQCQSCRRVLRNYERLAAALRSESVAAPARLDWELRERVVGRQSRGRLGFLPAAGSLIAAALVMVFAASLFNGAGPAPAANAFPVPNATSVALTTAVEIAYPAGVNKTAVESSVAIEPPVQVAKEWRGDTLVLRPKEPLKPNTTYSVIAPAVQNQQGLPLPALPPIAPQATQAPAPAVVTSFTTGPVAVAAAPSATPVEDAAPRGTPVAPAVVALSTRSATPAGAPGTGPSLAAAGGTALAARTPTPAATDSTPDRDLEWFLSRPDAAALALGAATSPARRLSLLEQAFAGGRLLARENENAVYALFADGEWSVFDVSRAPRVEEGTATPTPIPTRSVETATPTPAPLATGTLAPFTRRPSAEPQVAVSRGRFGQLLQEREDLRRDLGSAVAAERSGNGAMGQFANGTVLATDRRNVYVLYADGHWREFALVDSTPRSITAVSTPTPTPAAAAPTPAATAPAVPSTATPTPAGSWVDVRNDDVQCDLPVSRGFGLVHTYPLVKARIGCAEGPETSVALAEQAFESGRMLWHGDARAIYLLANDGTWRKQADTYVEGEPLSPESPPSGLLAPARGFGKAWRETPDARESLGWATATERGFPGASQAFANGVMLWSNAREIYVLYGNGTWEKYPDLFAE
jgi:anti-sigma factor RsiW